MQIPGKDAEARTRELEEEIAETREDLSETVEAIQEKLRPSHMMSQGTEALKTAATERVRDMADTATYTAHRLAESTKENLWPAVLIGAGVAWLLLDRARDKQTFTAGRYGKGSSYPSGQIPGRELPVARLPTRALRNQRVSGKWPRERHLRR